MALTTIEKAELSGQKVLCRFDFNVPLENKDGVIKISDTYRIDIAIPTIQHLLESGVKKIVIMSHLGRPQGKRVEELSLEPIANYLAEKLREEVYLTESAVDSGIDILMNLGHIKIIMLENLRFHPEEIKNDTKFALKLSQYADIYVNDAFGACHRKHASVEAITSFFPKRSRFCGLLIKDEVIALSKLITKPERKFIAIVGGAKVSDKIHILDKLIKSVDTLLIGGAMAYPFLRAKGIEIGKSLCNPEDVELAKNLLKRDVGAKIQLPMDHIVLDDQDQEDGLNKPQIMASHHVGMDIGPQTISRYQKFIQTAKTVFWNGPMGMFEDPRFSKGTFEIAKSISFSQSYSVVGGGDSVSAIRKSGNESGVSHISSGGGASLEFIKSGNLPALKSLMFHS